MKILFTAMIFQFIVSVSTAREEGNTLVVNTFRGLIPVS